MITQHRSHIARALELARLALLGATWLLPLTRRDPIVQLPAASAAPAETHADEPRLPRGAWRAAAVRTLGSDHHSFRVAVRRLGGDGCRAAELLVANGYDHVPQYLARIALRPSGETCAPESAPVGWSPRALHYSDVVTADLDGDGRDEIIVSAFGEAGGRMHDGSVRVVPGGDPWLVDPPALPLDDAFAPSRLAVGDLDGDGRLDLVVGTFWRGARGAGRDVKHLRGDELDGPTLLFRGLDPRAATFAAPVELAPRGAIDLTLADVDLDGALDLVTAGTTVTVSYGPDFADAQTLPFGAEGEPVVAPSVDVAWLPDRSVALVAFTTSCFSAHECERAHGPFGVSLWAIATAETRSPREARLVLRRSTPGIPSPARFIALDEDPLPDLIVGLMTTEVAAPAAPVVGRPWLGPLGLTGGAPLIVANVSLDDDRRALEPLAIATPAPAYPMASAITPYADARGAHPISEGAQRARPILTYTGPGEVVAAEVRAEDGRLVPVHHVPGDAHVSLVEPLAEVGATLGVTWRVALRPQLIITSACPVAGAAAGTLFIKPPERLRGSQATPLEP